MSADVIKEFLVSLGYKVDKSSEGKFKDAVRSATLQAQLLARAVEEAAEAAVKAVQRIAIGFDQLYWSAQRTGASAANLRAFGYAFSQLGGSVGQAASAVEGFAAAMRTNRGVESFVRSFGVTTRKANGELRDATETLEDFTAAIRKKYPSYDVASRAAAVAGIDEGTFKILWDRLGDIKKFKEEQKKAAERIGLNQDKAAENLKGFMQRWREFEISLTMVGEKIASDFAGPMSDTLAKLQKWFEDHSDDIRGMLERLAKVAENIVTDFQNMATALGPVWEGFDKLSKSLIGKDGLTVAFEALGVVLALKVLAPLLRISTLLGSMVNLPAWLAVLLGVTATGHGYQTAEEYRNNPESQAVGDAANARVGGVRSWWKKNMPTWLGGGSAKPISSGERAENAKTSYQFWRSVGLSHEAASAILASQQQESGFNPNARGDGGAAHGLFQHHGDRRAAIKAATGIDMSHASVEDQNRGAHWEMTQSGDVGARKAWKVLNTPGLTAAEYGAAFGQLFERPARDERAERGALAEKWAKEAQKWDKRDAPPAKTSAPSFDPGRFEIIKAIGKHGALNSSALLNSYLGGGANVSNDNSNSITLNQKTEVNVIGGSNPGDTAAEVVRHQSMVNSSLLRNAQGAVR